jgi:hypothetical protein
VFFKTNEPFKISTYMLLEQLLVVVKMHHWLTPMEVNFMFVDFNDWSTLIY